ncbi:phosphonate ABC transporter, permease protein PhnE [Microbacterium sp. ET2]|uniref:phosphonate ABC transporter, permease protein PhnE n=1 Tax=Microbacterium albipurpureum TaxID=3050384 RepID=UPI00259CA845|nr:phosphonate ABC transporter, permease protein PhnE [Microbacterium sp. ET2 (Ac-2212)]WJL94693.1 phosphonate ABC transporter, permease protein PhnE [Microbacterium sp. ET2 (Ac-2212)]
MMSTTLERPSAEAPGRRRDRPPRPSAATIAIPLAYLAVTVFAIWWLDIRPAVLLSGLEDIARLLQRMVPPTTGDPGNLLSLAIETLWIAIAGTGIATILSVFLGAAASRHFTGPRVIAWLARGLIIVTRAIPSLVFALILVRIVGLGPLAGGLAIAFHSIGMIGKMFADVFEELGPAPRDAIRSVGATRAQNFVATTLSRALPSMTSIVLYRLDINIRASAVLGLVGAGGLGLALQTAIGSLDYRRALGIILVIVLLLLALEALAYVAQRALSEHAGEHSAAQLYGREKRAGSPGWNRSRVLRVGSGIAVGLVFLVSLGQVLADPPRLAQIWDNTVRVLGGFFPPTFSPAIAYGILESVIMAFSATAFGVVIGLVIAVLSTRHLIRFEPIALALRGLMVLLRGVPDIIFALLFVAALGLGPFAGFLALTISCTALAAKFFTDALVRVDPAPLRALEATGATRLQVFVSGVWPQFVPSFIGNSLFTSDLALRESAVLGIVGAGGIGFLLDESVATLHYDVTAGILIALVVVVVALEAVAGWARRKVI